MTTTNPEGSRSAPLYPFDIFKQRVMLPGDDGRLSDKETGIRLGVSERTVRRMKAEGMTEWDVDAIAVKRFGLMPFLIVGWDEWFEPALKLLDEAV